MELGIYIPQVGLEFDELLARARRCEALGISSFWLFDHLYAPGLPAQPSLEGWTAATALLARTDTLRVGHLVLDNNLRHPALVAKMATTLDVISGGRLELGIGSGSYADEHRAGGFAWGSMSERTARLDEALEILKLMFANERTSFRGHHYVIDDLPNVPRPIQTPHPPIHVGGAGAMTLPLVAKHADVWNVPTYALADWPTKVRALEDACAAVGRDPATLRRSLEAVLVVAPNDAELAREMERAERRYAGAGWGLHEGGFVGTPAVIVERIQQEAARGIDLCVFFP
ncbi:MAG: LLM class flavin-dependent oxidoreductase, partial [Acidimicrobiales bacterium]